MPHSPDPPIRIAVPATPVFVDNRITVSSIAVLAYIVANVAHEGAGHALGFYLAGGKSAMLTTTRLIVWITLPSSTMEDLRSGWASGQSSVWLSRLDNSAICSATPDTVAVFLWLVMAFSLFWAFGYMIFSGITGTGDWMALIYGSNLRWLGRTTLS